MAALELLDRVLDQLDKHKLRINFYIDLSKAFDNLRHNILNKASTMKPVLTGVPQGSIIGPLLFNIFINDIITASHKFPFILYADDTTLNSTHDTLEMTL